MFWRLSSARTSTNAVKSGVISEILYGVIDLLHRLSFKAFFWHFTGSYCSFFFSIGMHTIFIIVRWSKNDNKAWKEVKLSVNRWLFQNLAPPWSPDTLKKKWSAWLFFFFNGTSKQNKNKAAFGISIRHICCKTRYISLCNTWKQ